MFTPNAGRIQVKLLEPEEKKTAETAAERKAEKAAEKAAEKIVPVEVPHGAQEQVLWGTVVAVGPGVRTGDQWIASDYAKDDVVCFNRYDGVGVTCDDDAFVILCEKDVLGKK